MILDYSYKANGWKPSRYHGLGFIQLRMGTDAEAADENHLCGNVSLIPTYNARVGTFTHYNAEIALIPTYNATVSAPEC